MSDLAGSYIDVGGRDKSRKGGRFHPIVVCVVLKESLK